MVFAYKRRQIYLRTPTRDPTQVRTSIIVYLSDSGMNRPLCSRLTIFFWTKILIWRHYKFADVLALLWAKTDRCLFLRILWVVTYYSLITTYKRARRSTNIILLFCHIAQGKIKVIWYSQSYKLRAISSATRATRVLISYEGYETVNELRGLRDLIMAILGAAAEWWKGIIGRSC